MKTGNGGTRKLFIKICQNLFGVAEREENNFFTVNSSVSLVI